MLAERAIDRAIEERQERHLRQHAVQRAGAHKFMDDLQKAGYNVQIAVVDAPREVVEARVDTAGGRVQAAEKGRAATKRGAKLGGRSVPSGVIRHMYGATTVRAVPDVAREVAERHDCVVE